MRKGRAGGSGGMGGAKILGISHVLNLSGTKTETLWMIKLMLLGVTFFVTFFIFLLCIRDYKHVGFMINTFR